MSGSIVRYLGLVFGVETDKKSISEAQNAINKLKSFANKVLGTIGISLSIKGIASLASAAGDVQALGSQFEQVFGDMAETAQDKLTKISNDTGVSMMRLKGSFVQIAAFAKTTGLDCAESLTVADEAMKAIADSAAFYDRSIEDVTVSMRGFLKGNYENDAALGLSCTQATRDAAAYELFGQKFMQLTEAQKQLTLLQMVKDANRLSGAEGQAAREADTWVNVTGNLRQEMSNLKATLGQGFLEPAIAVVKVMISVIQKLTNSVYKLTSQDGIMTKGWQKLQEIWQKLKPIAINLLKPILNAVRDIGTSIRQSLQPRFERFSKSFDVGMSNALSLLQKLQPKVEKLAQSLKNGFEKIKGVVGDVVDRLGGLGNTLKILAAIAIAFFIANNWGKMVNGANMFMKAISGIAKIFSVAHLKTMLIVAGITLLILAVQDFVYFLTGNNSMIGEVLGNMGVDVDALRDKFLSLGSKIAPVWESIKNAASAVFNTLSTAAQAIFNGLQSFWSNWGGRITSFFQVLWNSVGTIFNGFLQVVQGIADFIGSVFSGNWSGAWEAIKNVALGIWEMIKGAASALWDFIKMIFEMGLSAIQSVWNTVWGAVSGFFQNIWNTICSVASSAWSTITTTFTNIFNAVKEKVTAIKESIVEGFNNAIEFIKGLPEKAIQWGKDFIQGLIDGIKSGVDKIGEAVSGIGEKVKSFLHFSKPDEGPLADYEKWMPDFMTGLASGITKGSGTLLERVQGIAGSVRSAMGGMIDNDALAKMANGAKSVISGMMDGGSVVKMASGAKTAIGEMAKGVFGSEDEAIAKVQTLASGVSTAIGNVARGLSASAGVAANAKQLTSSMGTLVNAGTASVTTAAKTQQTISNSSITQNVNIDNSYTGGTAETQRNVSRAMKKSATDATTQMARALAYARG